MDDLKSVYSLNNCLKDISDDLHFYGKGKTLSKIATFLFGIPFKLMFWYRISRYLYLRRKKSNPLHILIRYRQGILGGNEFGFRAVIGKRIHLPHPFGIVIGTGVIIEDDVTIFQQVTFGSHGRTGEIMKYPQVKTGAVIYAGAKIIGGVCIGKNAVIGANSVVLHDIPDKATAAGIPAIVKTG